MVKLGSKVKDEISSFEGVATGRVEYLHGCPRVLVESENLEKGEPVSEWIDEPRLVVLSEAA